MKSAQDLQKFLKMLEPWQKEWQETYAIRFQHKINITSEQYAIAQLITAQQAVAKENETLRQELSDLKSEQDALQKQLGGLVETVRMLVDNINK